MSPLRPTRLVGIVAAAALTFGGLVVAGPSVSAAPLQPSIARASHPSQTTSERARAKPLRIVRPTVSCECGGAGYIWGWYGVAMRVTGIREGFTYRVSVRGTKGRGTEAVFGSAFLSSDQYGFEPGEAYTFVLKEYRGRKVTRTSKPKTYRVPVPVDHPEAARLGVLSDADGDYLVAGRTYTVTYDGTWEAGAQFAKGVDRVVRADGSFTWYQDEGYEFPWIEHAPDAELTVAPTQEHLGQKWNIFVIGSRPAPDDVPGKGIEQGDPLLGSEWGHRWFVTIISEEQAAEVESGA